jgi:hypothetical protein
MLAIQSLLLSILGLLDLPDHFLPVPEGLF